MNKDLIHEALEYAERGWKVFPLHTAKGNACSCGNKECTSQAKHPHIKEWQKSCSNQPNEIKDWWQKWPDANIGLATGSASGFFVLDVDPLVAICASVARYPSMTVVQSPAPSNYWAEDPKEIDFKDTQAPFLSEDLLPECLKPWVMDISERMQVTPEFVMAPALVSLSSVVGRKIGIYPKQQDDWLVIPNLWGAIMTRPGYFKSPTIAEALKPLEQLSERSRLENESNQHKVSASKMIVGLQLEALKDSIKKAIKEGDYERIELLKDQVTCFEKENEEANILERRYKTNDATVEKIARLLNENPNGHLLLRDELNGWLQTLNKAGREGDREFFLKSWNGYGSYTFDRVGAGTLHVPAICLSVFGGIQPGKLQAYVEKTVKCSVEDDGLLQRFQLIIYPELSPKSNIDRQPDILARDGVYEIFNRIDSIRSIDGKTPGVRFSDPA